jgi:hypothetical protein
MKIKLLSIILLFTYQTSFSQTEKTIKGHIYFENSIVPNVEVINANSKTVTVSDAYGAFSISAKANDLVVFVTKNYELKKVLIDKKILDKTFITVELRLKPEELKEVVITKMPAIKLSKDAKWEQGKLDKMALEKAAIGPKVLGVYTGKIENGMDIMRIGGMILGLFIKEKEEKNMHEVPQIEFTVLAKTSCNQKFYLENLKLKLDEIDLFLQFCDTDPKSKTLTENSNVLSMMDFLTTKNQEFKKLQRF